MKKIIKNLSLLRWMLALVLAFAASGSVKAATWTKDKYTAVEWNLEKGQIIIKVCYFDKDGGSTSVQDKAGFVPDKDGTPLEISFGAQRVTVECDDNGNNLKVNSKNGIQFETYTYSEGYTKPNTEQKWVDIVWEIPSTVLNVSQTIGYSGTWWIEGVAVGQKDVVVNTSSYILPKFSRSPISAPTSVSIENYTNKDGRPVIIIPWTRTTVAGQNADDLGDINFYYLNGVKVEGVTEGENKKSFIVPIIGQNALSLNQSYKFIIKQIEIPDNKALVYETASNEILVKAYPQIVNNDDFNATFNSTTRKINLQWTLPAAPTLDYMEDPFVIKTTKTLVGQSSKNLDDIIVNYSPGIIVYSHEIDVAQDENATYEFTIYRKLLGDKKGDDKAAWIQFTKSRKLELNTKHVALDTNNTTVELLDDNKTIKISWKVTEGVWSDGSTLTITRKNVTNQQAVGDVLKRYTKYDDIKGDDRFIEDNTIINCNQYTYTIEIKPNSNYTAIAPVVTTAIGAAELGELRNLKASKGYFSDRVELSWLSDGGFDDYAIERKLADAPDTAYEQISTIKASATTSIYTAVDIYGEAGKVYSYRVKGLAKCNNSIEESNLLEDIGFRTPTGDIYGRVTFENNQAEEGVEVILETLDKLPGKSLQFDGTVTATIDSLNFLSGNTDSITLQAWVSPIAKVGANQKLISKDGMYELGIDNTDHIYFFVKDNTNKISSLKTIEEYKDQSDFFHVSATYSSSLGELILYINGLPEDTVKTSLKAIAGYNNQVVMGEGYKGIIDEVRFWNKALASDIILRDYNRYLAGNEDGLIAYYTFNYGTDKLFFDTSYKQSVYNANHGQIKTGVLTVEIIPSIDQLGYKGVTTDKGAYSIRAVPYIGNGTAYTIIPRKGIHEFKPSKEDRFIGPTASSHTVNFVDMSTFLVSGKVVYKGGTFPVQGANFKVDGVMALESNGTIIATNAAGEFEIRVPVGTHEVVVEKFGHGFEYNGRICDQYGMDLNYQDEVRELILTDTTTIRYIGRVAGGTIQEAYPYGHSLSKNNLSDNVTVRLTLQNSLYNLLDNDSTIWVDHFKPSNRKDTLQNRVKYSQKYIDVYPNIETGEFVADIIPENYTVTVTVPGHTPFDPITLNATDKFAFTDVPYVYQDSAVVNKRVVYTTYNDTVRYQVAQKFIKRYQPEMRLTQVNISNTPMGYFGSEEVEIPLALDTPFKVPLFNSETGVYTFAKPVFTQGQNYKYLINIYEGYHFNSSDPLLDGKLDEVPTQDAQISFINTLATSEDKNVTISADSIGQGYYIFRAGEPELTTAEGTLSATFLYDVKEDGSGGTSINWVQPNDFKDGKAYLIGSHQTGVDFITAGPDKLLTVLRDPPGSNSYSYLEKGVSFTESSTYSGSVMHEGKELWETGFGVALSSITITPVGVGTATRTIETESGVTLGIEQEAQYTGSNGSVTTSVLTTRFQTSDSPEYVGPMADVFIGYSTNLAFGTTQDVSIVSRENYNEAKSKGFVWDAVYDDKSSPDWVLIQNSGISATNSFGTLFAYPQIHIEDVLIPQMLEIRNSLIMLPGEKTKAQLESIVATQPDTAFYLSKVNADSDLFGTKDSYDWIYNSESKKNNTDTISSLNASIQRWYKALADNEKKKVQVTTKDLMQNYSFHGGSNIEHTETYSTAETSVNTFSITVKGVVGNKILIGAAGAKTDFEFEEKVGTVQGGEFASEIEKSHSKGFVLAEDGVDYLTVDVYREPGWNEGDEWYGTTDVNAGMVDKDLLKDKDSYGSFIFKTRGGVTSCPYEGEYVAKYHEPNAGHVINVATMQAEVPYIAVEKDFLENVPSGETAKFILYLRNNSEANWDMYYDLKLDDASNPDGAKLSIDGSAIGNGRSFLVPAGNTLVKTLEVGKGRVLNYDNLNLVLLSQCQGDPTGNHDVISDTVTIHAHFVPSCSEVEILTPTNNWTYNTELKVDTIQGVAKHYLDVTISKFDVNYDDFDHIKLQYKSSSESDLSWVTLISYYTDSLKWENSISNGMEAEMIKASDAGKIYYKLYLDDLPDQYYDLRSVTVCNINNLEVENYSPVASGIKDMYNPRLFGVAQPANGVLTIQDEIRLNFNEQIAQGLMTKNNFQVTGVRNGSNTDHSTAIQLDGESSYMQTEVSRNLSNKDLTFETWINPTDSKDATIFAHGDINNMIELSFTADNYLVAKVGGRTARSVLPVKFDKGTWAHVALVLDATGNSISAYYNFEPVIANYPIQSYKAAGPITLGRNINGGNYFGGKMHTARLWDKARTSGELQLGSLEQLSGTETGLIAYYPMKEGKGTATEDKARGANLVMNACEWSLPGGYAAQFSGNGYLTLETSAVVANADMNYSVEFWFKTQGTQSNAVMVSNGRGDGQDYGGSTNLFTVGFDENGKLAYINNGSKHLVNGNFADDEWHHFVMTVSRTTGFGQIFMDGELNTFFDAEALGGLASANAYVGARGWYSSPNNLVVDNYFKGKVDELRIWNLNKTQAIIETYNNEKLNGEEVGLLAYYPFEKYITHLGVQMLEMSYDDQTLGSIASVATSQGDFEFTSDKAPVKDKGPVSNLAFEFVVNNDALIISLTESLPKIEKTIVTFTAMDIRDMNGNKILSPITWSAYIDQNQLRWSEENVVVDKQVYMPYEFTVQAVNKGGQIQNYSISNQPSWLDITPVRGSVAPVKSEDINFVIDEGLNIGTYNEVIYLTNNNGVSEALDLKVTVTGEEPNWSVNPADYKYNMSVFGKLRLMNIFSSDKRDKIAVFQNGVCIGVANNQYSKELDMYYAMLTVYNNNEKSDGITFRIWEANTGITYEATPSETITFNNNAIYGTPASPIIFDGSDMIYQDITLEKGWNWISFNLHNNGLSDVNNTLLNGSWTSNDVVKTLEHNDSYS